ncbi:MAG: hypothetical protein LBE27_05660 [Deltaproteobacteria bacterium]|jgi:predicted Fe-Mo cluster-binding NifX family protein|nr:hypothetical protein [Deltaproteobacteria bacterium]
MAETQLKEESPPSYKRKVFRPERVAIATESKKYIDACFGRTESFQIYQLREQNGAYSYEFLESRPGIKPCRDKTHDQGALEETSELLMDCAMVLAGRMGPAAVKALSERGIMGMAVPLELEDALRRLARG